MELQHTNITTKICTACKEFKEFKFFYKDKSKSYGLSSQCKSCLQYTYRVNKKPSNVVRLSEEERQLRILESKQRYLEKNREKVNKRRRELYKLNPDKRLSWSKNNKDKVAEYKRRWKELNKYNLSSGDYARRIQEKLATPSWLSEFDKFFINEIYHLSKLRTKALNINFEVDHVVPIMSKIVCGLHHPLNLEIVPAKLNRIKNNLFWPDMPLINEES